MSITHHINNYNYFNKSYEFTIFKKKLQNIEKTEEYIDLFSNKIIDKTKPINKTYIFSNWIFIVSFLYCTKISNFNPKLLLILAICANLFMLFYIIINKISINIKIFYKYLFIVIITKILPLFIINKRQIHKKDLFISITIMYIYIIYALFIKKFDILYTYKTLIDRIVIQ